MVFLLSTLVTVGMLSDPQTLREAARKHGPVEHTILREYSPVDLLDLAANAEVIAHALVVDAKSRLTTDERAIESDYSVQLLRVEYTTQPSLSDGQKITVTKPGGSLSLEGYRVTSAEPDFPSFQPGEEYVLFLRLDLQTGRYLIPYGAQGAFRVRNGTVEQVSDDTGKWNRERGTVAVGAFRAELADVISRKNR